MFEKGKEVAESNCVAGLLTLWMQRGEPPGRDSEKLKGRFVKAPEGDNIERRKNIRLKKFFRHQRTFLVSRMKASSTPCPVLALVSRTSQPSCRSFSISSAVIFNSSIKSDLLKTNT